MTKLILSNQRLYQEKKMSGRPLKNFLENHPVREASLVRFGWYYRNKPIVDDDSSILGVVCEEPKWEECTYEKLSLSKGRWYIIEKEDNTLSACVYTLGGEFVYYPLYNLIKVEETK